MADPNLHAGTVSWSKDDWAGTFYPRGLASAGWLAHYAKSFDTVEVDATFYRTPTPAMCRAWAEQTPPHFRFSLKVMQRVTRDKALAGCEQEMGRFLGAVRELGDKFAFAVLQFASFGRKSLCPDVGTFMQRLGEFAKLCPDRRKFVVEVRNAAWVGEELLSFLHEHGFVFALNEVDRMPKPVDLWARLGERLVTGGAAYARIFGERKKMEAMTQKYDRIILDRTEETRAWAGMLKPLAAKGVPVWAYFSNYFAGHAPGSAALMKKLWEE